MSSPSQFKDAGREALRARPTRRPRAAARRSIEFGRQFADAQPGRSPRRLVHQGADLYLKAVEQVPVPFVNEVAKVQTDWTLKATDLFVRQGRQLVQK